MATEAEIIARVRTELGDLLEPFRQTYRGDGFQNQFDLPAQRVTTNGMQVWTTDAITDPDNPVNTTLVLNTDFTLDADNGILLLNDYLAKDVLLTVQGYSSGMFTDDELQQFVRDAVLQHTSGGETDTTRYRDSHGFIQYKRVAVTLANLPEVEILPVALLATVNCLWTVLTDATLDVDITTSEGTHIPRSQRYAQLQSTIAMATDRYKDLCMLLGVGLYSIEVGNLRRISRQTGRLVPIYVEREYDENQLPVRIVKEIPARDADPDGPPSPAGNYFW